MRMVIPSQPTAEGNEEGRALATPFSPVALLLAFRRRMLPALVAGLLLALVFGSLVWYLRPPKYISAAFIRVYGVEQRILDDGKNSSMLANQYQKTQMALVKSRLVVNTVLEDEKIRELPLIRKNAEAAEWLEKELKAEFIGGTEILQVSLSAREHKDDLEPIVNAILKTYMEVVVKKERERQKFLHEDMKNIYEKSQDKLKTDRKELRTMANNLGTNDKEVLTYKQKNLIDSHTTMQKEVYLLRGRIREARTKLAIYGFKLDKADKGDQPDKADKGDQPDKADKGDQPDKKPMRADLPEQVAQAPSDDTDKPDPSLTAAVNVAIESDPQVQKAQALVEQLQLEIKQIDRVAANPKNHSISRIDRQRKLDDAQEMLKSIREEKRKLLMVRAQNARQAERTGHIRDIYVEFMENQNMLTELETELKRLTTEVNKIGQSSIELEMKRIDIEQSEIVIRSLRNQMDRLQVELQSNMGQRVVPLSEAQPAVVASKYAHLMETGAALFGGLLLGVFGVSFREYQAHKLYTPACVRERLGLKVMGTIPPMPRGRVTQQRIGQQILIDSVDSLRTMLLQSCPEGSSSILMITSAWSGEGKTTLSSHLANSLARSGHRTLLVDCDLRCPSLHQLFNLNAAPGVCDLLTGAAIEETVQATAVENLSLLAAGELTQKSGVVLAQGGLREVFNRLRSQYQFIVVDSSPLLAMPDTMMVGKAVDGVVLSVRSGISQAHQVYAAYELLRQLALPFVGTVVNGNSDRKLYTHNSRYAASLLEKN